MNRKEILEMQRTLNHLIDSGSALSEAHLIEMARTIEDAWKLLAQKESTHRSV